MEFPYSSSLPLVRKSVSNFRVITLENGGKYDIAYFNKDIASVLGAGDAIK